MRHNVIKRQRCAGCGHVMNRTTNSVGRDASPRAGMVSICFYCGHIGVFADARTVREPTPEEYARISMHPLVIETQIAVRGRQKGEG
jgi:hypothetical protein